MENLLMKYLEARIKNDTVYKEPGPVITISREYGCPAKILAGILADKLKTLDPGPNKDTPRWRWIGRELLEESAKNLNIEPAHINHIWNYQERTIMDDILAATKKDGTYKSDTTIKKTVAKVIRTFGEAGHVIIVGRAGVVMNRDIKKSLHIRLMAPLEWRIGRVMQTQSLSKEDALSLITMKDSNRKRFLEFYFGQKFQLQIFDAIYNCAYLSLEEIGDCVLGAAKRRDLY